MKYIMLITFSLPFIAPAYACEASFTPDQCKTICSKADPVAYATCMLGAGHSGK